MKILNNKGMLLVCDSNIVRIGVPTEVRHNDNNGGYELYINQYWGVYFNGTEIEAFAKLEDAKQLLRTIYDSDENIIIEKSDKVSINYGETKIFTGNFDECRIKEVEVQDAINRGFIEDLTNIKL